MGKITQKQQWSLGSYLRASIRLEQMVMWYDDGMRVGRVMEIKGNGEARDDVVEVDDAG